MSPRENIRRSLRVLCLGFALRAWTIIENRGKIHYGPLVFVDKKQKKFMLDKENQYWKEGITKGKCDKLSPEHGLLGFF